MSLEGKYFTYKKNGVIKNEKALRTLQSVFRVESIKIQLVV